MSRRDMKMEWKIREAIADYVRAYGAASTRTIAEYVRSQLGERPANDTVARILREMGYKPLAAEWVKS